MANNNAYPRMGMLVCHIIFDSMVVLVKHEGTAECLAFILQNISRLVYRNGQ